MSQAPHVHGDTSDRLFTAEDLERFARQQLDGVSGSRRSGCGSRATRSPTRSPVPLLRLAPPPTSPPPPRRRPRCPATARQATAGEPRRFMTATDFLDRRDSEQELGPANWGWRGRIRRWSGGLIEPNMGAKEEAHETARHAVQKDFDGPRTIAFINPKGGAAKTTGVLAAGYTFGTVRGGGVVAWDNNETRGTLGIRGTRSTHRNTTRELLEDLGRFKDVYQSRIGDLGAFVRSQGDAHFDVLASDERPDVTGHDPGHGLRRGPPAARALLPGDPRRHRQQHAGRELARRGRGRRPARGDQHGPRGHRLQRALDARRAAGRRLPRPQAQDDQCALRPVRPGRREAGRATWSRSTSSAPGPSTGCPTTRSLVSGSVVPYSQLSEGTRSSWLRACAGMAEAL